MGNEEMNQKTLDKAYAAGIFIDRRIMVWYA